MMEPFRWTHGRVHLRLRYSAPSDSFQDGLAREQFRSTMLAQSAYRSLFPGHPMEKGTTSQYVQMHNVRSQVK